MVRNIHVCCGSSGNPHDPVEMAVNLNGVDIFREPNRETITITDDGWKNLAHKHGVNSFEDLILVMDKYGGYYYGSGDRLVCHVCGSVIVWRG